ncbi:conserved hypothetical protein [Leishmania major strain Friedlin]|uniref:Uncharacterized protein n=1 Tax=Leishmania major TaxID=5664 RepID=Q4QDC3_LEIMA|nr:conserved hypothetical protein [Leishmania major strain Friedlin]CAG9572797.1 hypothetical_protein_-_conserved [Leishmania major strain Friedlin]CAJ07183.1 conserved hypothetical protein [Leishmania major strain Friedlin]|eukprot:XP_001682675.1 conserved hypothetical protein [Leishmania major strain Friedlin]
MDVLLHVVQTAAAPPASASSFCSDRTRRASLNAPAVPSASISSTSFTVESLWLSHREAPLGSNVADRWSVALCSRGEDENVDGFDGDPPVCVSAASPGCPPASPSSPIPSNVVRISAASVDITDLRGRRPPDGHATNSTVNLLCEKLRHSKDAIVRAGNADTPPVARAETVFFCGSRLGTRKDALYLTALHRLLVESLLIVKGRALSPPSPPPLDVDVSLVDYDEGWGAGDVLAAEVVRASAYGTQEQRSQITWMPLANVLEYAPRPRSTMAAACTSAITRSASPMEPSADSDWSVVRVGHLVRQRLQVWFDRIDSATSAFPSAPASPLSPPAAADRLRHLERNVVLFTLRLRSYANSSTPTLQARVSAAYFTLVLLPENGAAPPYGEAGASGAAEGLSSCRASAALWHEFEALSAFMRSLPQGRRRRDGEEHKRSGVQERGRATAATVQGKIRAAALRRSRWLTTIARIHNPPTPLMRTRVTGTGERGVDDAMGCFLKNSTVRSFSWIGCIAAAASHQRATRSTLAFLSRLQPSQTAQRGWLASVEERSSESAADAHVGRHHHTHKNAANNTNERVAPKAEAASSSVATSTPPLPSPRPSANVPHPYASPRLHGGSATDINSSGTVWTAAASHLPPVDELSSSVVPVAAPSRVGHARCGADNDDDAFAAGAGHEPASRSAAVDALIASVHLYASVLEEEVRRLRRRLQRYEAPSRDGRGSTSEPPVHSTLPEVQGCESANTSIGLSTPHTTSPGICDSLPQSVRAAIDDLRTDARFPQALHVKLDALAQRLASLCTAAVQARRGGDADLPTAMQQRNEKSDDRDAYVAQLEAKVALYERKLVLMDYYVAPTLMQCVDDLDQWQKHQHRQQRTRATRTGGNSNPSTTAANAASEVTPIRSVGAADHAFRA